MRLRRALLISMVLAGCGTEAPAPEKPTWVDDVQPILAANCFHCHGWIHNQDLDGYRWDIYNPDDDPKYAELGFPKSSFVVPNAPGEASKIVSYVGTSDPKYHMPPLPATSLDARDIAVLQNWVGSGFLQGQHNPNHKPRIAWVAKPLFEVVDDDHDQVLGQLDCGGMKVKIDHTGGWTLPAGVSPPCNSRLYDGFEEADDQLLP